MLPLAAHILKLEQYRKDQHGSSTKDGMKACEVLHILENKYILSWVYSFVHIHNSSAEEAMTGMIETLRPAWSIM